MGYRPKHHLTAPQGHTGAPNGLALVGDELHVFYQHNPTPECSGWGHAATTDGGTWRHFPMALYSAEAGSAVVHEGRMRLLTAGAVVDAEDPAGPMGGVFTPGEPLVGEVTGYATAPRDPHISRGPDGTWRMVLGAQRENHTGAVLLYTSTDLDAWKLAGEIEFAGLNYNTASAHTWERPNLVRMTDRASGEILDVLVFSPRFPDSDECGYVAGRLEGLRFEVLRDFTPLDFGHTFAAPQLLSYGGGALMIGSAGNSLTLVRELSLIDASLHTSLLIPTEPAMLVDRRHLGASEFAAELVGSGSVAGAGSVGASIHWQPHGDNRGTISLDIGGLVRWAECRAGEMVLVADGPLLELTAGYGEVAFASDLAVPDAAPGAVSGAVSGEFSWAELRPARS